MTENKEYQNPTTKNKKDNTPLSIIYVRKKLPEIQIQKVNTTCNMNVKVRNKILKNNKLKIINRLKQQINSHIYKSSGSYLSHKKVFSMPILYYTKNEYKTRSSAKSWTKFSFSNTNFFKANFLVYLFPKMQYHSENPYLYYHSSLNTSWKIYRCQLNTNEESCCCSCNSDAMFEVMKSLYDCYKKKNCDNCNCILCGHLPREERRLGELRKSGVSLGLGKVKEKKRKRSKETVKRKISLKGKSPAEKEQILKDLIASGAPLPEPKTKSDKELIKKIQTELGRPQEIKPPIEVTTLETKKIPSEKLHKLKEAGLLTPLEGKSSDEKEKILRGLAMNGIPLPKGKSSSDKKLIDKVRKDVGLPPEPKTSSDKKKYDEAMAMGLITPLLGKSESDKEKILKGQADLGLSLPEGRTASEKKLIAKVKATALPSAKLLKSKVEGILTPLQGKSPEEKENVIKDLAMKGIPLPEGKTASEKKLIDKVRKDVGLPPQPKTPSTKEKYSRAMAAGAIVPLEGKTDKEKEKILKEQAKIGLPLPEGRTASEKKLIAKVKATTAPSAKLLKSKVEGILTPLQGKSPEEKENVIKDLAMKGIPLPEGKTASEKKLIDKVRAEVGLPPQPKTPSAKEKYSRAMAAGAIVPLEGKTDKEKEKILKEQAKIGLPLPEGRTSSEKKLIAKVKATTVPSTMLLKSKVEGILTPLQGKSPEEKENIIKDLAMKGIPLPEGKTASEKKLIDKVRKDVGLPPQPKTPSTKEKYSRAMAAGAIVPLEGKSNKEKEKILKEQAKIGLPLPEGRTASEKKLIAKVKATTVPSTMLLKSKVEGILTPLQGKSPEEKENVIKDLALKGIPLPEGKTASEKKLIDKVRKDVGLPPQPKTPSTKEKYSRAMEAGAIVPLEGKTDKEKEKILKEQAKLGLPLPEGRTASEKKLIAKVKATTVPSAMFLKSKVEGILTPLQGKSPEEKENVIKDLAMKGIPLPEGKTASEKKLIDKVRAEVGLPPQPKTPSAKEKYSRAMAAGAIVPLEGKTDKEKEKILKEQAKIGLPLPEGRTASEKKLIAKVKATTVPSAKLLKSKIEGILTPLQGKSPEEKENVIKDLAMKGIPLPEGKTASEKKLIDKVRKDVGLPPEPTSKKEKGKYEEAVAAGLITPLEGKPLSEKERILQGQADLGLKLPEGRSPSEKALIKKIKSTKKKPRKTTSIAGVLPPDERKKLDEKTLKVLKEGKGPSDECICGLITPELKKSRQISKILPSLKKSKAVRIGDIKTPQEKEKIIRELAQQGAPLPEAKTVSEKKLIEKVQADLGLPAVPTTPSLKEKYVKAQKAGLIVPLEGKTPSQKEKILTKQAEMGIMLPEGRTPSEKALVDKIRATVKPESISSDKLRKAKQAGLLTPLEGKSPEEKKRIIRNIVKAGLPLPEGKTPSEKQMIRKIKDDIGLPSKGIPSEIFRKAKAAGLITPLDDKTQAQKEKILRDRAAIGLPLPEGVTSSDKELIKKIKTSPGYASPKISPEKLKKSKTAGLLAPLDVQTPSQREKILIGKTPSQKEKLLRSIAKQGLPLPEPKTISEKALIDKVQAEAKATSEIKAPSAKLKLAKAAGLLTPLEGKTPEQKEKILKGLTKAGIPLPEGKSSSEKKLIEKVREEMGLPPEPKTSVMKNKMKQAQLAGIITPLEGKSPTEKEKIIKKMHEAGIPLPKGRTASEKSLIKKIKADVETQPKKISSIKSEKITGLITPLEGKTTKQKEGILRGLAQSGLPLPEGKTTSEKALINKIKAEKIKPLTPEKIKKIDKKTAKVIKEGKGPSDECICGLLTPISDKQLKKLSEKPSKRLRKTKTADLLASLSAKTPEQIEKKLKDLAVQGIPLPEAKTTSEKKLINKIRADVGLPPEPKTPSLKEKYNKAIAAGLITPLQGKSNAQKEKILRGQAQMGVPLPEGRTPSEKDLIAKVKATTPRISKVSLEGKSPEQKDKILRNLALQGIPFPEAKTPSEKKLMDKVRLDVGLPPEPKTPSLKEKYNKGIAAGLITPLQGKTDAQKEKILRGQAKMGLPLPEGRTPSEKDLIAKVKATTPRISKVSLEGKSPEQKDKILRNLALQGIPFPEAKTPSEKKLMDKVRLDVGLPPEPKTPSLKEKYNKGIAAGLITPLQGKSDAQKEKILRGQAQMGVPLPEGRTPSEKDLIAKVKATTPRISKVLLEGKSPEQKDKILRNLALQGIPFPEAKTASEKKLMDKVRVDVGLPPEPKTPSLKEKYNKGIAAGLITPLQGKTDAQKEKILRGQAKMGLPLPEGRTPSEKDLIAKVKATTPRISKVSLEGKSPEQKDKILRNLALQGIPFPEAKTPSEKKLMDKVRLDVGLPPEPKTPSLKEKYNKGIAAGLITPLQGKTDAQKERILRGQAQMGVPLPEGRTPSEKDLIAKVKATTPRISKVSLEGKSPEQKDKILRNLALQGIPFPEAKTPSEKKLMDKVRLDLGLPPEPKTPSLKEKYNKGVVAGLITPLQGKTDAQKEKILRGQAKMGLPLPEGRTPSEKDLIAKVKATTPHISKVLLEGKSPEQKDKILRNLALQGIPFPEAKTPSEKKLMDKVRLDVGLPPEPKTRQEKDKYESALAAGLVTPLEGKTASQKEKILRGQAEMGLNLPKPRTSSEKAIMDKIKTTIPTPATRESVEKIRKSRVPSLEGKTSQQKEQILKGLAMQGMPLPEPKTGSEKKLIDKVRADVGLPPEPKTASIKEKYAKAKAEGLITPLQGKTAAQKEKILRGQAKLGLPLPEGRTPSEKALISKIKEVTPSPKRDLVKPTMSPEKIAKLDKKTAKVMKEKKGPSDECICHILSQKVKEETASVKTKKPAELYKIPSEKLRKAKDAGLLTPLQGKSPAQKEKILKGLAMQGLPLPEAKTASEKKLIDKVRSEIGLPPEPKTKSVRKIYNKAMADGYITPLQGKTEAQKEKILRKQAELGLPLPEGRTASEKNLIAKIKQTVPPPLEKKSAEMYKIPSEKLRKAKDAGLLTPLQGKSPAQKEKILKGLAMQGLPLPEAKTASEKKLIDKVRSEIGLPPEPKTKSVRKIYNKAMADGYITPLQGKTEAQKEKILRKQAELGLPLPEGRTASEKNLIAKIKQTVPPPLEKKSAEMYKIPSEKLRKAKDAGLLTPLQGKSPAQKEKILKGLAMQGLPLPEAKTASEKKLIDKVISEIGLPPEPKTKSVRKIYNKAMADGYITPLQGKTEAQKEKILRKQAELGLPLPEGRTASEKNLIAKIKQTVPPPSEALIKSEKMDKAKAAPVISLEGKRPEEKEKILKNLAEAGLLLPEGKTASEKSLIKKIKNEYAKLPKAKEKKSKTKTKSKKIGVAASAREIKKRAGLFKSKGAITEEFQDIIKTTTCDRGCGCDKKKIRFKHSYVKIRVTSPDISSLCPCPEECVPGVKGGVFTDNEGIKVTVGRVTGTPSFSSKKSFGDLKSIKMYKTYFKPSYTLLSGTSFISGDSVCAPFQYHAIKNDNRSIIASSKSETEVNIQKFYVKSSYQYNPTKYCRSYNSIDKWSNFCKKNGTLENIGSFKDNYSNSILSHFTSSNTSFDSIHLLGEDSSVSLVTLPDSISVFSFSTTGSSSVSSFYESKKNVYFHNVNHILSSHRKSNDNLSSAENIRNYTFENYECSSGRVSQIMTYYENNVKKNIFMLGKRQSNICNLMKLNKEEFNSLVSESSYSFGIHQLISRILWKRRLYNSSSLIVIISTSSDEQSSQYFLRTPRSTIGVDLSEKNCNWNYKANSLHHLHQKQKGFKLTATGRTLKKNVLPPMFGNRCRNTDLQINNKDTGERNLTIKEDNNREHYNLKKPNNNCRIISTDTTQDRPCCCEVKKDKLLISSETCQSKMDDIVTQLVTPIILKEVDAQGLDREAYINSPSNKIICQPRLPTSHSKTKIPINRRNKALCRPHSTQICDSGNITFNDTSSNNVFRTCDCDPDKLREFIDKRTKEMISKACNIPTKESLVKNVTKRKKDFNEIPNSTNVLCESCGTSDKKLKQECPCEQHTQKPFIDQISDNNIITKNPCQCKEQKRSKKNKKIICECPEEPEPEIDFTEWIDEKQIRKLQSDLTQTKSGFKIEKPRKKDDWDDSDFEMRFEEALKYIAENLEDNNSKYNKDVCSCASNSELKFKNASVDCECPNEIIPLVHTEQTSEEEPFTGIKFHISGKGSGSKGLNGILCFELLNNLSEQSKFNKQEFNKT